MSAQLEALTIDPSDYQGRESISAKPQTSAAESQVDETETTATESSDVGIRVLTVQVLRSDGSPAPGAVVQLTLYEPLPQGQWRVRDLKEVTDDRGNCELKMAEEPRDGAEGTIFAIDTMENVSAVEDVSFPSPWGTVLLRLHSGGVLQVHVEDDDGLPVKWATIWPTYLNRPNAGITQSGSSDRNGDYSVSGIPGGVYWVQVSERNTNRHASQEVDVVEGETRQVTIRLPAISVAVSGRVVDDSSAPLEGIEVVFTTSDGQDGRCFTDEEGSFEWKSVHAEKIRVVADPEGDLYRPDIEDVPFGTPGLVFRRVRDVPESSFRVELTDSSTGERISEGGVLLSQDKPLGGGLWFPSLDEPVSWKVCGMSRYLAAGRGFREAFGPLDAHIDRSGQEPVLRVSLEFGTRREVIVFQGSTSWDVSAPSPDVAVHVNGEYSGKTDQCGRYLIDCMDPDPEVLFIKQGFKEELWHPQRSWDESSIVYHDCWKHGMTMIELHPKDAGEEK
jgi:hypothetical protein